MNDLPSNIALLMRRSTDGGKTWQDQQVIRQDPAPYGYGDPSVLVDRETERIFVFYAASFTGINNPASLRYSGLKKCSRTPAGAACSRRRAPAAGEYADA